MTIVEVIPIISSLSHTDKFRLIQILLTQLAKEDGVPLQADAPNPQDPLFDIIGIAEGEDNDISQRHDDHLYKD